MHHRTKASEIARMIALQLHHRGAARRSTPAKNDHKKGHRERRQRYSGKFALGVYSYFSDWKIRNIECE
jgi:hypothetical protein